MTLNQCGCFYTANFFPEFSEDFANLRKSFAINDPDFRETTTDFRSLCANTEQRRKRSLCHDL